MVSCVLCSGSHKAAVTVSDGLHSLLELGELFQAHVIVGRIQFQVVVGLRSLFSCWLSAKGCSQLSEALQFFAMCPYDRPFESMAATLSKMEGESLYPVCKEES